MTRQTVQTTLGDLIVALTDEAARIATTERERYRLVAAALTHLLASSPKPSVNGRMRRQVGIAA